MCKFGGPIILEALNRLRWMESVLPAELEQN